MATEQQFYVRCRLLPNKQWATRLRIFIQLASRRIVCLAMSDTKQMLPDWQMPKRAQYGQTQLLKRVAIIDIRINTFVAPISAILTIYKFLTIDTNFNLFCKNVESYMNRFYVGSGFPFLY